MVSNSQLDLAYNFVQFTNRNIFLTGKAGTGKTTFLHNLKSSSLKRMAIVAPTGVAAINAGGVTIHSFFQLPFGPFVAKSLGHAGSNQQDQRYLRFHKEKINLIRSLDLLVIDEISMVRADTLDGIDEVLRRFKDHNRPFGGVQLLMIGDLHQLAPVVKEEDWRILGSFYPNLYFFNSKALQVTPHVNIELKHIYRQTDQRFIDLLNHIRENRIAADVLARLNERFIPGFNPPETEGYITLTTHNQTANELNLGKLESLEGEAFLFNAMVQGDFPEYAYPTSESLRLKVGAQVMFVKNDPSREKLFYNGKIGSITRFGEGLIYVKCPHEADELEVGPAEWKNITYKLDSTTKEIEENVAGTFTQFPLKLAWAITIHKSQGLTFEKAIIDAGASFAHGQVYVALSRCKSFEGLVLRTPISFNSVKTDGTVSSYTRLAEENAPGEAQLFDSKVQFQQSLIFDLFDLNTMKIRLYQALKLAQEHDHSLPPSFLNEVSNLKSLADTTLYPVSESFKRQLASLMVPGVLPEENEAIRERIQKAAGWFSTKIATEIHEPLQAIPLETDNKEVRKSISEAVENLTKELFIKLASFKSCESGFNTLAYLKVKANAEIDFSNRPKAAVTRKAPVVPSDVAHPVLYNQLKEWRNKLAAEQNVPVYIILPQKAMLELSTTVPGNTKELEKIKGIGKKKLQMFGKEILEIISNYLKFIEH